MVKSQMDRRSKRRELPQKGYTQLLQGNRLATARATNVDMHVKIKKVVSPSLNCMTGGGREPAVVSWNGDTTPKASEDVSVTLRSQQGGEGVGVAHAPLTVRRLTPIECERLQGFPDNWTSEKMELTLEGNEWKATSKVVKQADGPRYKQMGNARTVNVGAWIGKQIGKVLDENND